MKPLIALTGKHREKSNETYIEAEYNMVVLENDGMPFLITYGLSDYFLEQMVYYCQGLLITGGGDLDPGLYGGARTTSGNNVVFDRRQDDFDLKIIQLALRRNLPILAIGRGMQLLNVVFGGTLYQDISREVPNAGNHQTTENGRNPQTHRVVLREDTLIIGLLGKELLTNSDHHQAVKELGGNLVVSGMSTDGVIEAIEYGRSDRWLVGVQWHPERSNITSMQPLMAELIRQAKGREEK
jgi:putative glutamine amidotransferase